MWYLYTAFVTWVVDSLEELVGETLAPLVFYLAIVLFFGLAGYLLGSWLGVGE